MLKIFAGGPLFQSRQRRPGFSFPVKLMGDVAAKVNALRAASRSPTSGSHAQVYWTSGLSGSFGALLQQADGPW